MAAMPGIPYAYGPYPFSPSPDEYICSKHGSYRRKYAACPECRINELIASLKTYEMMLDTRNTTQARKMGNDIFVMLNNNKYADLIADVEARVSALVEHRHDFPIWPLHDGCMDEYEQSYHGGVRKSYYGPTLFLIQTLRRLRNIS